MADLEFFFDANIGAFAGHVAQLREILQGLTNPLRAIRENLGEVAEAFAAAFAVEKISEFINKMSEMGADIDSMSQRLGISTGELQNFTFAASEVGIGAEEAGFSLQRLSLHIADAAKGAGGMASEAFDKLGITVKDGTGKLLENDIALRKIADAFAAMPDGVEKTTLAMELLGRTGARMIPVLNLGGQGFDEARKRAVDLGLGLSQTTVAGMVETSSKLADLGAAFKQLGAAIFDVVKGPIDLFIDSLTNIVAATAGVTEHIQNMGSVHVFELTTETVRGLINKMADLRGQVALAEHDMLTADAAQRVRIQEHIDDLHREIAAVNERAHAYMAGAVTSSGVTGADQKGALPISFKELEVELKNQIDEYRVSNQRKLAYEIEFWQKVLADDRTGNDARLLARQKLNEALRANDDKWISTAKTINDDKIKNEAGADAAYFATRRAQLATDLATHKITKEQEAIASRALLIEEADGDRARAERQGQFAIEQARQTGLAANIAAAEANKKTAIEKINNDLAKNLAKNDEERVKGGFDLNQKLIDQASSMSKEQIVIAFQMQKTIVEANASTNKITQDQKFEQLRAISVAEEQAEIARINARLKQAGLEVAARVKLEGDITLAHQHGEEERTRITADQQKERHSVEQADISRAVSTTETILDIRLTDEKDNLDAQVALHKISTDQKIAELRRLTAVDFDNKITMLENQKLIDGQSEEQLKEIDAKILVLQERKNAALLSLDRQAAQEQGKIWDNVANTIKSSFDTMLRGVLQGTQTVTQAMKNLWNNLVLAMIEGLAKFAIEHAAAGARNLIVEHTNLLAWLGIEQSKVAISASGAAERTAITGGESTSFLSKLGDMIAGWLGLETTKTAITSAQGAERVALVGGEGVAAKVAEIANAFGQISIEATVAAAAAFADSAMTGPAGLAAAPGVSAAAFAYVMGLASGLGASLFAESGALIPPGVSPLVRLHQNEIVLPASLASGFRSIIAGQGRATQQNGPTSITVHVTQPNATADQIAQALQRAVRNFHPALRQLGGFS